MRRGNRRTGWGPRGSGCHGRTDTSCSGTTCGRTFDYIRARQRCAHLEDPESGKESVTDIGSGGGGGGVLILAAAGVHLFEYALHSLKIAGATQLSAGDVVQIKGSDLCMRRN